MLQSQPSISFFSGVQMPLRDLILVQLLLGDEIARQRAPDSALDDILALGGNQAALLDGLTDGISSRDASAMVYFWAWVFIARLRPDRSTKKDPQSTPSCA